MIALKLSKEFVIHSSPAHDADAIGEAGADAFTIMRIAGHSSVTVSQRYVHPTPEGMERAFDRLEKLNAAKFEQAEAEAKAEAAAGAKASASLQKSLHRKSAAPRKSSQVVEFKRTGP